MKTKAFIILGISLLSQWGYGQLVHIHWNNSDYQTRAKLTTLIATLTARNASIAATNAMLSSALLDHKNQLRSNYTRNSFDRQDGFLASSMGSASLSLMSTVLSKHPSLPYMARAKKEYLEEVALDKAILIAIQHVDAAKIKSSDRQQIYQLRGELIRQFSKNDQQSRKILMFSAAAMVLLGAENYQEFLELLDSIEIAL